MYFNIAEIGIGRKLVCHKLSPFLSKTFQIHQPLTLLASQRPTLQCAESSVGQDSKAFQHLIREDF